MSEPPSPAERLAARVPPGTVLGDRYRLESLLGAGAFGVVWRGRHVHLETECAVKLFDPPPGADLEEMGTRFLQEARVTARLKSPYVPRVFDYGVHERMPFLVLELLHGTTLTGRLNALRAQGLRMPAAETVRVLRQVAEALHVAHAESVVHRDLKPDNIFLMQEGDTPTAKVLDFGIAKWSAEASPSLTTTGMVMGTPHYMSPEQFESARQVDHRSDLWSLGVLAFECLTGQLPFPGETFIDVAFRVCKEGPLLASQLVAVPPGFDAWFARATAVPREYRFDSAREQVRALEAVFSVPAARAVGPLSSLALPRPESMAATSAGAARTLPPATLSSTQPTAGLGPQWRRLRNPALALGALSIAVLMWRLRTPEAARTELALGTLPKAGAADVATLDRDTSPALAATGPEAVIKAAPTAAPTPAAPPVAVLTETPPAPAPARLTEPSKVNKPPPQKPAPTAEPAPKPSAAPAPRLPAAVPVPPKPVAAVSEPPIEAKPEPAPAEPPATSQSVNEAAARALGSAASLAASCRPSGGPTGFGKARVVYSNDGTVASVEILTAKFRDTPTGSCLRMVFRRAAIPPFKGEPPAFIKSFVIPES